jgi:hypothetical protein
MHVYKYIQIIKKAKGDKNVLVEFLYIFVKNNGVIPAMCAALNQR